MKNKSVKIAVAAIVAAVIFAFAFTAGFFTRKLTQGNVLSSYEWFFNTIEEQYYYDVEGGYSRTGLKSIAEKYLDRYSAYYTAEEYAALLKSNSGSKSGIGITFSYVAGRGVYIGSVEGNSPAYISGLRAGEWLSGGSTAGGQFVAFNSASDFSALVNSVGVNEPLILYSATAEGKTYQAAKSDYTASYTSMSTNYSGWTFGDSADGGMALYPGETMSFLPDGAAYIRLAQFYGTAAQEFYRLIEKFNAEECTSLILDLRSNGGGYVNVMQDIAGSFSGGGKRLAMVSRSKSGSEEKYYCAEVKNAAYRVKDGTPVYVLANAGTASASEALIGALICYGVLDYNNIFLTGYSDGYLDWLKSAGGEVKTERTYGKGIMQSTFINGLTGDALKLTTAQIYWPDGTTCIHDRGITTADGCISVSAEWEHTIPDDELKAVAEIIKSR